MEAAVAVFLLWVNPLKDSVMLETSIWILLQQYQQKFFGWVRYLFLLGVRDQVHNPGLVAFKFHWWLQLMRRLVFCLSILRSEKRQKYFFLLTHQVMSQHISICVLFTSLSFNLFINVEIFTSCVKIYWDFLQ